MIRSWEFYKAQYLLLLLAAIWCLIAFLWLPPIFDGEKHNIWYQRSGAVAAYFSLLVEFMLMYKTQALVRAQPINRSNFGDEAREDDWKTNGIPGLYIQGTTLFMALYGTLTWAYGDLIYNFWH